MALLLFALALVAGGWCALERTASPWRPPLAAALLAAIVLGMSRLAGWLTGWEYLATDSQFPRLADLARRWDIDLPPLARWSCGPGRCGAFVLGFLPGCRALVVTDGLWNRLCADEVEAILAHELAHLRRRHPLVRLWVLLAPLGVWLVAARVAPEWIPHPATGTTADGSRMVGMQLIVWGLWLVYARWAFGRVARLLEHEADLDAAQAWSVPFEVAGRSGHRPPEYAAALAALGRAGGRPLDEWTWQHGRLTDRLAALTAAPRTGSRLRSRVRLVGSLAIGALVGGLAGEFWAVWADSGAAGDWLGRLF